MFQGAQASFFHFRKIPKSPNPKSQITNKSPNPPITQYWNVGETEWRSISIDRGDPTRNTLYVGLGGLGLPDRDNYLVDNERNREMRAKYLELATFLLTKAGDPTPRATAEKVYALEKQMAADPEFVTR